MRIHTSPLGLTVLDIAGEVAGRVESTYPDDGCAYEFALVRLARGRFGESRLVPLEGAVRHEGLLQVPFTFAEMDDAPATERFRYASERADHARAYWTTV